MKLLLETAKFNQNQSALSSITQNQESVSIGNYSFVYCDLSSQSAFLALNINSDYYAMSGTGILLPPKAVEK